MDKIIENRLLSEKLYEKTLSSGLQCFTIPKEGFSEKHAMLVVNYGSADLKFKKEGKIFETPQGLAHFLEHKTFEGDGIDYFDEFTKIGGNVNAYTNFNVTAYYFSCNENFEKCLNLLYDMVLTPFMTDETVEKEKGIIEQEISMYDDDPSWRVYFNMLQSLYDRSPAKHEIAGTAAEIAKIDRKILMKCFETFYTPGNMALVCAGDFDLEKVYEISEEKTKGFKTRNVEKIYDFEPENAVKKYCEDKMAISKPLFCLGFKDSAFGQKADILISSKILLDILAGDSSRFFNDFYKQGLLDNGFGMDYSNGSCYSTTMFSGATKDTQRVVSALHEEISAMIKNGIDEEVFRRIKNKHMGRYVRSFNSVGNITGMQADFYPKGFNIFDVCDSFERLTAENVYNRLLDIFKENNHSLSVVK